MTGVTVDQMLALNPCDGYDRARLIALWNGRESLTATDLAELDIDIEDRIWAVVEAIIPEQRDEIHQVCVSRLPEGPERDAALATTHNDIWTVVRHCYCAQRRIGNDPQIELKEILSLVLARVKS